MTSVGQKWVPVDDWSGIGAGDRVKMVVGEETFVGTYFAVDDDDARCISHLVNSDAAGGLRFGGYSPDADALYVHAPADAAPWACGERADTDSGLVSVEPPVDYHLPSPHLHQ